MAKRNSKDQSRVPAWYLIVAIVYSCIAIAASLLLIAFPLSLEAQLTLGFILSPIVFGMLIFNIVMLIFFIVKKVEKVAWLLAGLYLFDFVFSMIVGIILIITMGDAAGASVIGNLLGMLIPIITLVLAIKLLLRSKR